MNPTYGRDRGENTEDLGGVTPATEKTRQFAGKLNPLAGHKFSLTVGACEAPSKIVKVQLW